MGRRVPPPPPRPRVPPSLFLERDPWKALMQIPALRELAETLRSIGLDFESVVERVVATAAEFEYETIAADDPGQMAARVSGFRQIRSNLPVR